MDATKWRGDQGTQEFAVLMKIRECSFTEERVLCQALTYILKTWSYLRNKAINVPEIEKFYANGQMSNFVFNWPAYSQL